MKSATTAAHGEKEKKNGKEWYRSTRLLAPCFDSNGSYCSKSSRACSYLIPGLENVLLPCSIGFPAPADAEAEPEILLLLLLLLPPLWMTAEDDRSTAAIDLDLAFASTFSGEVIPVESDLTVSGPLPLSASEGEVDAESALSGGVKVMSLAFWSGLMPISANRVSRRLPTGVCLMDGMASMILARS